MNDSKKTFEFDGIVKECLPNTQFIVEIDVNGSNAHEIFIYLKNELKGTFGRKIRWNFTKFLIDKEGKAIKRFSPYTKPEIIDNYLSKIL